MRIWSTPGAVSRGRGAAERRHQPLQTIFVGADSTVGRSGSRLIDTHRVAASLKTLRRLDPLATAPRFHRIASGVVVAARAGEHHIGASARRSDKSVTRGPKSR